MTTVTLSQFRAHQSELINKARTEPVHILARGRTPQAVLVSPDFFTAAIEALEELEDIRATVQAREEGAFVDFDEAMKSLDQPSPPQPECH